MANLETNVRVSFALGNSDHGGRNANGIAEVGGMPHPFWKTAPTANGFELWDDRTYGFGQQDVKP